MDGDAILSKVQETYLKLQSYMDVGTAKRVPPIGNGTPIEFATFFDRPSKFRFEWKSWHPHQDNSDAPMDSAIWTNKESQANFHFLDKQMEIDFVGALAGATGVSSGSVLMITTLLLPACIKVSQVWYEMKNARILGAGEVNGFTCYHLVGDLSAQNDMEAWIGENDFLIRRLRLHSTPLSPENRKVIEQMMKQAGAQSAYREDESFTEYNYSEVRTNEALKDDLFCQRFTTNQ